ncbi:Beta-glucanase-like protein [Cladobotryum mycophilum]|uniref:Beta-glucanase-like protein n=1 Tax=Cladobotryum mycophilum TaxID=491253 RepID=A0ABR0ST45_9HYPO
MTPVWQDTFVGCGGCQPSTADWNIMTDVHTNNEIQNYTSSPTNLQLSGGQTLQIIPWLSPEGLWTSARIESTRSWIPQPGKVTQFQSTFRTGTYDDLNLKKGMWPAFWLLGDALRHGTPWPLCGELDIFEQVNGLMTGYGTAHCIQKDGGPCNEPAGLGKAVDIPNDEFHTWTLKIDRTSNNWWTETIQWFRDGTLYHTLTGSDFADPGVWSTLAHSPCT